MRRTLVYLEFNRCRCPYVGANATGSILLEGTRLTPTAFPLTLGQGLTLRDALPDTLHATVPDELGGAAPGDGRTGALAE